MAVIGAGWWATQFHLPGLLAYEPADVVALVDIDDAKLRRAAAHFDFERTYRDHRDLIAAGDVDGVVVAVPHAYHYEIARDCLDAGLHVMLEKPMVLRAADAWDLVARARSARLHLVVGYTYQFTQSARRAYEAVRSGVLGEIRMVSGLFASMVESYYRGRPDEYASVFEFPLTGPLPTTYSDPAISGGGQAQTQITHAIGMVFWVTGLRATEVFAFVEGFDLAVDLVDAVGYRLEGGGVGTMGSTGTLRPGQPLQQELRYYGTEGILLQDLARGTLRICSNDGTDETSPPLDEAELYPADATSRCLVDLIAGRGENYGPPEPAAAAVEFIEAAYRSATSGRPVRIDEVLQR